MTVTLALVFAVQVSNLEKVLIPLRTTSPVESSRDLRPLGKLIGEAQIVGAGEATHGSKEIFQLKHRLFKYLVEEKGFTVLALEANMAKCLSLDRYVLTGEGDAVTALKEQGFWTWTTTEVLELIQWMRAYNTDPKHVRKLRVVGVDMQSRNDVQDVVAREGKRLGVNEPYVTDPVWYPRLRYDMGEAAAAARFRFMVSKLSSTADAAGQQDLGRLLLGLQANFDQASQLEDDSVFAEDFIDVRGNGIQAVPVFRASLESLKEVVKSDSDLQYVFDKLSDGGKDGVDSVRYQRGMDALLVLLEKATPHQKALQAMYDIADLLVKGLQFSEMQKHSRRDQYMAKNLEWVVSDYLPGQKAMFWGHNWHVMSRPGGEPEAAGGELDRLMPGKYFSVGFAFGSGGFRANDATLPPGTGPVNHEVPVSGQGGLDEFLGAVRNDLFFVSTGRVKGLSVSMTTRNFGSRFDKNKPANYIGPVVPSNAYDGMIFIRKVSAAKGL